MTNRLGTALVLLALLAAASAPAVEPSSDPRPAAPAPAGERSHRRRGATPPGDALDSIVSTDSFLPAVHINGATGVFRTDVWIFNPGPSLKTVVDLYFTQADRRRHRRSPGIRITPASPRASR